jgi:acyl-CoA hydrolase
MPLVVSSFSQSSAPREWVPVSRSKTTMTELMIPAYANFGGKVHGGVLLRLMDEVAYACAAKHAARYCVTVSVDGVYFRAPVEVGDLISLRASVNYVGRTSLLVGIRVEAENVTTGALRHTNTSYVTMVAKNQDGSNATVPGLILETHDDVRRCLEAIKRRKLRREYDEALEQAHIITTDVIEGQLGLLEGHRCRIAEGLAVS